MRVMPWLRHSVLFLSLGVALLAAWGSAACGPSGPTCAFPQGDSPGADIDYTPPAQFVFLDGGFAPSATRTYDTVTVRITPGPDTGTSFSFQCKSDGGATEPVQSIFVGLGTDHSPESTDIIPPLPGIVLAAPKAPGSYSLSELGVQGAQGTLTVRSITPSCCRGACGRLDADLEIELVGASGEQIRGHAKLSYSETNGTCQEIHAGSGSSGL